jgi:tellurite resistance protein TehA-like permease
MSERGAAGSGRLPEVKLAAKNLPPAYFAMVMVTGIVSIAALMLGMQFLAVVLFVVNLATYAVLIALAILRLAWFRDALLSDLADHRRAPGFFTAVAGSCLIRSRFILIAGAYAIRGWSQPEAARARSSVSVMSCAFIVVHSFHAMI